MISRWKAFGGFWQRLFQKMSGMKTPLRRALALAAIGCSLIAGSSVMSGHERSAGARAEMLEDVMQHQGGGSSGGAVAAAQRRQQLLSDEITVVRRPIIRPPSPPTHAHSHVLHPQLPKCS